ncbi:hypothetical protein VNI00_004774 [Paramarasmius palmivorus]|uniref:Fungal-type protein kinase domain-containing protein n=1 Tax=Paramarasmius palmivorus TaxID=297713 RepID=A0AAW0DF06_9AGAR
MEVAIEAPRSRRQANQHLVDMECRTTGQLERNGEKRFVFRVSFQYGSSRRNVITPCTAALIGGAQALNFVVRSLIAFWYLIPNTGTQIWISHFDYGGHIQRSASDVSEAIPRCPSLRKELDTFHRSRQEDGLNLHSGLSGRSSWILYGNFRRREASLKLSHVETSRTSEVAIIEQVRESLDILPCLPEALASAAGFHDLNTCHIQQSIGIKLDRKTALDRLPRAIVFDNYLPLVSLTTDMERFRAAFARLICCHAILWLCGIERGDISVGNLMCSKDGTPKLCDYDLSYLSWEKIEIGFTNTGTLKFMASELLTDNAMNGEVQKVYRHDAEAFAWVLLWILGRYRDGKQLDQGRLFDSWAEQVSFAEINTKRSTAFTSIMNKKADFPQPLSNNFRGEAFGFIAKLRGAHLSHESAVVELAAQESFEGPSSNQELEKEIAEFRSAAFITKVLNTRLIASSEYSGLVKDALKVYMAKENNSQ